MTISRFAFLAAAGITSSLVACQFIVGVDDENGAARVDGGDTVNQRPVDEAGPGPTGSACQPVHPPGPDTTVADGGNGPSYMFAVRTFKLRPHGEPAFGYDLDDRCTGDTSVTPSDSPCTPYAPLSTVTDDPNGLDNAFGRMLEDSPLDTDAGADPGAGNLEKEIEGGRLTVLVHLVGYNGQANDDYVTAALATSNELSSTGCDDSTLETVDSGVKLSPKWNGCDTWSYAPGTPVIEGKGGMKVPADVWQGYVVDHTLVVPMKTLKFGLGGRIFTLVDATLTGTLEGADTSLRLAQAKVSGRVEANELITVLSRFELDGVAICEGGNTFVSVIQRRVCDARDLPLHKADDGTGSKCNAVSFTLGFDAEQARMGFEGPAAPEPCPNLDASCTE